MTTKDRWMVAAIVAVLVVEAFAVVATARWLLCADSAGASAVSSFTDMFR
jgi:hypothetical protein